MEERGVKKPRKSSKSKRERKASRREWLKTFSTMKVGLPKQAKPTMEPKGLSSEAKVTTLRVTSRPTGVEVKRRLEKLHEHLLNMFHQIIELSKYNETNALLIEMDATGFQGHICYQGRDWNVSVTTVAVCMGNEWTEAQT